MAHDALFSLFPVLLPGMQMCWLEIKQLFCSHDRENMRRLQKKLNGDYLGKTRNLRWEGLSSQTEFSFCEHI